MGALRSWRVFLEHGQPLGRHLSTSCKTPRTLQHAPLRPPRIISISPSWTSQPLRFAPESRPAYPTPRQLKDTPPAPRCTGEASACVSRHATSISLAHAPAGLKAACRRHSALRTHLRPSCRLSTRREHGQSPILEPRPNLSAYAWRTRPPAWLPNAVMATMPSSLSTPTRPNL